uniref:[ribulose-bisphosphate carboxylase]-lysine N-methyltransferase n=1 Tax=Tetraselmis sp. GSL018 TaxID=582737 RepID=A0A061RLX0_9CHLO
MSCSELLLWLRNNGGFVSDKVSLFAESSAADQKDKTIRAVKPICEDEKILVVPMEVCIYYDEDIIQRLIDVDESCATSQIRKRAPSLDPFLATTLLVLHEQSKGESSRYWAYLSALPRELDCTIFWTPEELEFLTGTSIAGADDAVKEAFQQKVKPLLSERADLWAPKFQTYNAFRLAYSLVQSRGFRMRKENWLTGEALEGDHLYMLPAIDMLNHSAREGLRNAELSKVDEPMSAELGDGRVASFAGFFAVRASRRIEEGEELLISYGDLGDAQLLRTYGFVEDVGSRRRGDGAAWNPNNRIMLSFAEVTAACRETMRKDGADAPADDRAELLHRHGVDLDDPLPDDLLAAVVVMHMDEEELREVAAAAGGDGWLDELRRSPSLRRFEECESLHRAFRARTPLLHWCREDLGEAAPLRRRYAQRVAEAELRVLEHATKSCLELMCSAQEDGDEDDEEEADDEEADEEESGGSSGGSDEDPCEPTGVEAKRRRVG